MLKYGIVLPYGNSKTVAEQARAAEDTGWDGIFVGDAIWCEDPLIQLAGAAVVTQTIRLGTMITPAPLRIPWQLASQTLALDILSEGRLVLGLGTGATWMGWQAFPDVAIQAKTRAEMLDETIDILTLLYRRKPFDYAGRHYHLKLTHLDERYYPPAPVQKPRIPIWIPGIIGKSKPMQRVLKCDGVFLEKMNQEKQPEEITPADVCQVWEYISANRTLTHPFDIVISGETGKLSPHQVQEKILPLSEAGLTWWVESTWGMPGEQVDERIKQGPPEV